ncbi:MAG: NTP transferase domain-containing protein [Treponema sp.]|jgi:NDP-sugar pyrophosphorylase family protein|nr:NTP transferase domain-containing protein [Treponema sp.]
MMKGPVLVVLAAGMGSRYGGLKQMDRIGQRGEALLDYSVFDAKRAGFARVVFIIRHDMEADFREIVLQRIGDALPWDLVFQDLDSLIPPEALAASRQAGRTKPWGTAHALLCAADKIDAPFAILNADDFYGRAAFEVLGKFLASPAGAVEGAIVPYSLHKTLSPQGTVTRGVCEIRRGLLCSVDELKAIAEEAEGHIYNTGANGTKQELARETPVSMNFWGFPPSVIPHMRRYFEDFLAGSAGEPRAECYLPTAADWLVKGGLLDIRVLQADSEWFGVTYREDREMASARIGELVRQGVYPPALWGR